jgi:RNA polymerase sigma factor (sigma-70 family)
MISPEDVMQEACFAAFDGLRSFRPRGPGAVGRWLIRIVNSKLVDALNACRALKRGGDVHFVRYSGSWADLYARARGPQHTPSRELSAKEVLHAVQVALAALSAERRRAICLRYLQGLTHKEIAHEMSKSEPAVNSLLYNALCELRVHVGAAERYFSDLPRVSVSIGSSEADKNR